MLPDQWHDCYMLFVLNMLRNNYFSVAMKNTLFLGLMNNQVFTG